jgi:DoxX-like family
MSAIAATTSKPELIAAKVLRWAVWPFAAWIACVFLWYLQYKFTGHPGSTYLFTVVTDWLGFPGHEKAMRIGTGVGELVAAIVLFVPRWQVIGAGMALGIMTGAIFFHLVSPLGIDPYGDGGVLFKEACATWAAAAAILAIHHRDVMSIVGWVRRVTGL